MSSSIPVTLVLLVLAICGCTSGRMVGLDMPPEVASCHREMLELGKPGTNGTATREPIDIICLKQFLWKSDRVRWSGYNVTEDDMKFINSLIPSVIHAHRRRSRRSTSGFRVRREYRRLTDGERKTFHKAVNVLKRSGAYDTFANIHQGIVIVTGHNGPNFFGWHRVYCALLEEALRRVSPGLSLPYWDSSLDFAMDNPINSVIWTPQFIGNGDGFVTSGPFAHWPTPVGPLTRNIASESRLISKEAIQKILSRCRTSEISYPTAKPKFNLELAHNGPHMWTGGQMSGLNTAAWDPLFFMHHSFIDYLWELFRQHQRSCGVNPNLDYPGKGPHAPLRHMDGMPGYKNIDGYQGYWTKMWYGYEHSPTCSKWRPFCGSPYLWCDVVRQRCVSVKGGKGSKSAFSVARGRAQAAMINVGPKFVALPSDGRTQDVLL